MRIISGLYRGRILKTQRGRELRPTSDRLRETLFDVLGSTVEGSIFIDGYAGSGAVGLEALSRGARQVFLIEENAAAFRIIQANLAALGVRDNVDIMCAPVRKGLRMLEERGVQAGYCFLDPPYAARREYSESLLWLSASRLMATEGLIILEHGRKDPLEQRVGRWSQVRIITHGSSSLSFYRRTLGLDEQARESYRTRGTPG